MIRSISHSSSSFEENNEGIQLEPIHMEQVLHEHSSDVATSDHHDFNEDSIHTANIPPPPAPRGIKEILKSNIKFLCTSIFIIVGLTILAELSWENLDWKSYTTLYLTIAAFLMMVKEVAPPHFVMMGCVSFLLLTGILETEEGLKGFSNKGMAAVGALFVVAQGIQSTGALDLFTKHLLKRPSSLREAQVRLLIPVGLVSGFIPNTPLVAMMIPVVLNWSKRVGLPPSKLLMPLSFACILGGTVTLIGTSVNLVVEGLAVEKEPDLKLNMFEIALVGLPVLFTGIIYIILATPKLLPVRDPGTEDYSKNPREYSVGVRVQKGSYVIGKSIESAGLRHLPGLFLFEIQRQSEVIAAPPPETHLYEGDVLLFAGIISSVKDLWKIEGLSPATDQIDKLNSPRSTRSLVECVVSPHSNLVDKTVRETHFRTQFNAAIVAVHRQGEHIRTRIGDIELKGGDTILLEAGPSFVKMYQNSSQFALVSQVGDSTPPDRNPFKMVFAICVVITMIILNAVGYYEMFTSALGAAFVMLIFGCLTFDEALSAINSGVLLTIAAAFGLSDALEKTHIADNISNDILYVTQNLGIGSLGILLGIYSATAFLTELISNAATVALMFPIAYSLVEQTDLQLKAVIYVLMMAASSSFSTPIGYQTNLMVFGAGGYKFGDYFRLGFPLQIIAGVISVALCHVIWNM